jgi:tRNA(Ile)-lysidine synthase
MSALPQIPSDALPADSGRLLLAFSGGLDSSVLLAALAGSRWARSRGLRALHVDHGLHPQSAQWAAHCRRACAAHGIELILRQVVVCSEGSGLEQAAREARYAAARSVMQAGEILVTAHHLDDQAETFLLRALRGSGERGLGAMRPLRDFGPGWLWRPLLAVAREELLAAASVLGLAWIEDPANAEQRFDRNFLRAQVLPLLRQRWPDAAARLARSAQRSAEASIRLDELDAVDLAQVQSLDHCVLSLPALRALPAPRRARVLRHWLVERGQGLPPSAVLAQIERELLNARGDSDAEVRWATTRLRAWDDSLHLLPQLPAWPADWQARWDGREPLALPDGHRLELHDGLGARHPEAALPQRVVVRARSGGERIRLANGRPSQKLKNLLLSLRVPPWQRPHLPLLYSDSGELLAVADLLMVEDLRSALLQRGACLRWCGPYGLREFDRACVESLD